MGYVALSRLRSLAGLKLLGLNDLALLVNEQVLEMDKTLKQFSQEAVGLIREIAVWQKHKKQREFLRSLPYVSGQIKIKGRKQAGQISTYDKTKVFIEAKLSLQEVAKHRQLSQNTIVGHLEKIAACDKGVDLEYLRPPRERFEKIKGAFEQTEDLKLSPVREILGDDFSYQEIRLARLFLVSGA